MLESDEPGLVTCVEYRRCRRGIRSECHAVVIEVCAWVEFVHSGLDCGLPDLKTKFVGEVFEPVESGRGFDEWNCGFGFR